MSVVHWSRGDALDPDPLAIDDLDGIGVLVLEDVSAADDGSLSWCVRAPCVVVAVNAGGGPSGLVDVVVEVDETPRVLEALGERVHTRPGTSRTLVHVLRATSSLPVEDALVVESLAYSMLMAGPEFASWLAMREPRQAREYAGDPVRVARVEDELRVTLARPENRNAFSASMRDALLEALFVAEVDSSVRGVLLTGEGPVFSSGGDLTEFGVSQDVVRAHHVRTLRSVGAVLARIAPLVTVVVHGSCVGAGVELPAFAGRVLARQETTFCLPEVSMGLIPGAGGTVSVSRRIGRQRTARIALLGEEVTVESALEWGLIDGLVSDR